MPAIAQTYLSLPSRNRSLMTGRPTRAHLRAASVAVGVLTVLAVLALPIAQDSWTMLPGFVPATGAATAIINLMVACLLLGQARVARAGMPLRLAGAYIFATAAILPHLLAFPGGMAATRWPSAGMPGDRMAARRADLAWAPRGCLPPSASRSPPSPCACC